MQGKCFYKENSYIGNVLSHIYKFHQSGHCEERSDVAIPILFSKIVVGNGLRAVPIM